MKIHNLLPLATSKKIPSRDDISICTVIYIYIYIPPKATMSASKMAPWRNLDFKGLLPSQHMPTARSTAADTKTDTARLGRAVTVLVPGTHVDRRARQTHKPTASVNICGHGDRHRPPGRAESIPCPRLTLTGELNTRKGAMLERVL